MFLAKLLEIFKRVDTLRELKRVLALLKLIVKAAPADVLYVSHLGFLLWLLLLFLWIRLQGLHPLGRDASAVAVHFFAVIFLADNRMDAEVAA